MSNKKPTPRNVFHGKMLDIFLAARDPEGQHDEMDKLMCELLRELGYGDGVDVFERQEKWYS